MNSKTISPQEASKALDEKDSGSVVVKNIVDGENDKTGGESLKDECMPIEEEEDAAEDQEAPKIRILPTPNPPSRQEALEHNCTHIPFRSWCQHCVRGKSKSSHHKAGAGMAGSETPVVSFDYAFLGDRRQNAEKEDEDEGGQHVEDDDVTKTTVLVGRDAKSRVCCAIPVPQKGIDMMEWSLREGLRFLDFLGYASVVIKSDQEVSLGSLLGRMKTHRGEQTQTMIEHSPVGDSKSNGFIERTIQSV